MTAKHKTRAFVFKKNDANESDKNFSVFTEDYGRLEIFAKAIRKINSKLRCGIDIFSLSDVEFIQGKNKKTLTDAVLTERFGNIAEDFNKFAIANKISEALDSLIKGQEKDKNIFDLINETFSALNYKLPVKKCRLSYYYFLWNIFSLLGYGPQLYKCSECFGEINPYGIYFSNKLGGVVCKKCLSKASDAGKINSDIVKVLRIILNKKIDIFSKLKIAASSQEMLKEISEKYYLYVNSDK